VQAQSGAASAGVANSALSLGANPSVGQTQAGAAEPAAAAAQPGALALTGGEEPKNSDIMENVSTEEKPGFIPLTVRFAPGQAWKQRTVYINNKCNSDDLKWALRSQFGCNVSTLRVHEGFRGMPYDRYRPLTQGPPGQVWLGHNDITFLVVPSFGP
jgi:hypothetical protein